VDLHPEPPVAGPRVTWSLCGLGAPAPAGPHEVEVTVLLALASAVAYGVSDFTAGVCSRRASFVRVSLLTQASAAVVVLVAVGATTHGLAPLRSLAWGGASGIGGAVGTLALYRGFGRARIGVVAPLSAVGAAALPVLVGLVLGERPAALALAGVGCAIPAVWLVARSGGAAHAPSAPAPRGVVDGLVAGAGFGLLFIGLERAGTGHGLWPVAAGQVVALVLLAAASLAGGSGGLPGRSVVAGSAASGLLAAVAVICYFLSTAHGLLAVVAVLASLYPGVTVLLARAVLGERMGRGQQAGLGLAAVAIVLIVLGG